MGTKVIPIGAWCLITSAHLIADNKFNQTWPQGIFGRIIDRCGNYYTLRTYTHKYHKEYKKERHPHIRSHVNHIKEL